jgi:hypothetical protein
MIRVELVQGLIKYELSSGVIIHTLEQGSLSPSVPAELSIRQVLDMYMGNVETLNGIFESEKCALINLYLLNDEDIEAFETRVTFDNIGNIFESKSCIVL